MLKKIILNFILFILSSSVCAMEQERDVSTLQYIDLKDNAHVAFSPDDKYLFTGKYCNDLTLWNLTEFPVVPIGIPFNNNMRGYIKHIEFSPSGRFAIVAIDTNVSQNPICYIQNIPVNEFPENEVHEFLYLFDFSQEQITHEILVSPSNQIVFSPDEKFLVIDSGYEGAYLWNLAKKTNEKLPHGKWRISFSHDSKFFAQVSRNSSICIFDITKSPMRSLQFEGPSDIIRSLIFNPDNSFLYFFSDDKTLDRLNFQDPPAAPEVLSEFDSDATAGSSTQLFSNNGKYFIFCHNKTVNILNLTSDPIKLDSFVINVSRYFRSILFSKDERYAAIDAVDQICLFDLSENSVKPMSIEEANFPVNCIAFNSDSTQLMACSDSGAVNLWNLSTNPISFERLEVDASISSSESEVFKAFNIFGNSKIILAISKNCVKIRKLDLNKEI